MPKIIPDVIQNQTLTLVPAGMPVSDAARLMRERNIAAVMITDGPVLMGIMTERDITRRVVADGLNPVTTPVGQVMTANPDTLGPDDRPLDALKLMQERGFRHIPVVSAHGGLLGMLSIRDLYSFVTAELENNLRSCELYVAGESYGVRS